MPFIERTLEHIPEESAENIHRNREILANSEHIIQRRLQQEGEAVLDAIPGSRELVAASFGIAPEELTPQMDHVATFLHELGHTKEFQEFLPEAFVERKKAERTAMPLGPMPASSFVTPGSKQNEWFMR